MLSFLSYRWQMVISNWVHTNSTFNCLGHCNISSGQRATVCAMVTSGELYRVYCHNCTQIIRISLVVKRSLHHRKKRIPWELKICYKNIFKTSCSSHDYSVYQNATYPDWSLLFQTVSVIHASYELKHNTQHSPDYSRCTLPTPPYTPHWLLTLGLLDIQCLEQKKPQARWNMSEKEKLAVT